MFEIAQKSFPEIKKSKIRFKTFAGKSSFFKARFSISRFLTFQRTRYLIYVNPRVYELGPSKIATRSILAHELAHLDYYRRKNRFELLGLSSLMSKSFTARFERRADIEAIARGYGTGLIEYREWLYRNIPKGAIKSKKRNYFTPPELKVMLEALKEKPDLIGVWRRKVPRNLEEVVKSVK